MRLSGFGQRLLPFRILSVVVFAALGLPMLIFRVRVSFGPSPPYRHLPSRIITPDIELNLPELVSGRRLPAVEGVVRIGAISDLDAIRDPVPVAVGKIRISPVQILAYVRQAVVVGIARSGSCEKSYVLPTSSDRHPCRFVRYFIAFIKARDCSSWHPPAAR